MEKWIDILTTSVPRGTTEESFDSYFKYLNFEGYKIRWLVNLDRVPELEDMYEETLRQIHKVAEKVDEFELYECHEPNQLNAIIRLMRKSENDCLLLQDDRIIQRHASIANIDKIDRDYITFQYKSIRWFSLSPCFVRKELIQRIVSAFNTKKRRTLYTAEKTIVRRLRGQLIRMGCCPLMARGYLSDIGVEAVMKQGLVKDYSKNKIGYMKAEKGLLCFYVATTRHIRSAEKLVYRRCYGDRLTLFYPKKYNRMMKKRFPSTKKVVCKSVDYKKLSEGMENVV